MLRCVFIVVWYRALSLRCACIRSSGFIMKPSSFSRLPLCQILFLCSLYRRASPRRRIAYSITHPAYLVSREPKLALRNKWINATRIIRAKNYEKSKKYKIKTKTLYKTVFLYKALVHYFFYFTFLVHACSLLTLHIHTASCRSSKWWWRWWWLLWKKCPSFK